MIMLFFNDAWKSVYERRMVFLLTLLFGFLFGIHAWASLFHNYCVFCFAGYVSFFLPIGFIIAVIAFSNYAGNRIKFLSGVVVAAILVIIPGLFLGSLDTVGRWILNLPAPRFKGGRILPGSTELGTLFENRFQLHYDQLIVMIPLLFGLAMAVTFIALVWIGHSMISRQRRKGFGYSLIVTFFVLSTLLTPTPLLGHSENENTCGGDTIDAYETAGKHLAEIIPAGASVYWGAGSVVTPLIYLTHAQLHPPQLNGLYSYRSGGERYLLEKIGFYNQDSVNAWIDSDDFLLISEKYFSQSWQSILNPQEFLEHKPTLPVDPCKPESAIRIFERIMD